MSKQFARPIAVLALAALMMTACSGSEDTPEPAETAAPQPETPETRTETPVEAPELGRVDWPDADAYCAFFEDGHDFVFDDPDTWIFVFLTEAGPEPRTGYAELDGALTKLDLFDTETSEGNELRRYQAQDSETVVELSLSEAEAGPDYTSYEGVIRVTQPVEGASIRIYGDCGA